GGWSRCRWADPGAPGTWAAAAGPALMGARETAAGGPAARPALPAQPAPPTTPAGGMTAVAEWLAPLHIPLIRRAALTLLVAGTTFSVLGVVLVTLNLTVMRFALLHVGLLGAAVAAVAGWEPLAGGAVAIAAAAFLLGPTGDRLRLAPSATSALFMTGSLALAFALFYKAG